MCVHVCCAPKSTRRPPTFEQQYRNLLTNAADVNRGTHDENSRRAVRPTEEAQSFLRGTLRPNRRGRRNGPDRRASKLSNREDVGLSRSSASPGEHVGEHVGRPSARARSGELGANRTIYNTARSVSERSGD